MQELIRIDKWLWVARFYKTRRLAANAVEGGRVHVNGKRTKPSYRTKENDVVLVTKADYKQEVVVCGVASQRRSASEAQLLYQESEASIAQRELAATQRKILNQGLPRTFKKPNKHERQKIREMLGKEK
jgi:ribosome-associated heat shock protein Hsp15